MTEKCAHIDCRQLAESEHLNIPALNHYNNDIHHLQQFPHPLFVYRVSVQRRVQSAT